MATLTEKQAAALAVLRNHRAAGGDWMTLTNVAIALGTNARSAGAVLGALERLGLVLRWEPIGPAHPRFTAFEEA